MWEKIKSYFLHYPERLKVARFLVENGLRISQDGRVFCDIVQIPTKKIGDALKIDRRTVKKTVEEILKNPELKNIFLNLKSAGPSLKEVAKYLGFGVIVVYVKDPHKPGIIAETTGIIAKQGLSIRQIIADDPDIYPTPKEVLITETPVSGEVLEEILKVDGVEHVEIY